MRRAEPSSRGAVSSAYRSARMPDRFAAARAPSSGRRSNRVRLAHRRQDRLGRHDGVGQAGEDRGLARRERGQGGHAGRLPLIVSGPCAAGPARQRDRPAGRRVLAAVAPLLPRYVDESTCRRPPRGVLTGAYAAGNLVAAIPAAWLAGRWGVKPTTLAGLAGLAVSSLVFGLAPGRHAAGRRPFRRRAWPARARGRQASRGSWSARRRRGAAR